MRERERATVTGLVILMLVLWLGFLVHRSGRFAGSLGGGILGVSGGALMLVPLLYSIVKRVRAVRARVTARVSMRTLLAWHIYAGVIGPILVVLHSGHKFESPLGIALTALTIVVVLSGFVGRYLMKHFTQEIREKKAILENLESEYRRIAGSLSARAGEAAAVRSLSGFFPRLVAGFFATPDSASSPGPFARAADVVRLAEAIADMEFAIKTHESFKRWFGRWLKIHIVISFLLYGLLALHVWAAIHFGLRWFA